MNCRALGLAMFFASSCYAQPNKAAYELQERCGKQARETFKRDWPKAEVADKDGTTLANYRSHYSAKLNRCFYIESSYRYSRNPADGIGQTHFLYDVNENREFGRFMEASTDRLVVCSVMGKQCASFTEWEALIKPYMED